MEKKHHTMVSQWTGRILRLGTTMIDFSDILNNTEQKLQPRSVKQ